MSVSYVLIVSAMVNGHGLTEVWKGESQSVCDANRAMIVSQLSELSRQSIKDIMIRCEIQGAEEVKEIPKAVAPAPDPKPVSKPKTREVKVTKTVKHSSGLHSCHSPKHSYFHRRGSRTWWTCK